MNWTCRELENTWVLRDPNISGEGIIFEKYV